MYNIYEDLIVPPISEKKFEFITFVLYSLFYPQIFKFDENEIFICLINRLTPKN